MNIDLVQRSGLHKSLSIKLELVLDVGRIVGYIVDGFADLA
jgi:hypothetical protein